MTGMHNDPQFETRLRNLAQGQPDTALMQHVSTCDDCQGDLNVLRELVRYRDTTGGLADVPQSLVSRLAGLLPIVRPDLVARGSPSAVEQLAGCIRRITADLLIDSGATPHLAGLRGGVHQRTRQFAFVSDVADLDLEVSQLEGGYTVTGQLGMDTVPPNLRIRFVPADEDPLADQVAGAVQSPISNGGYFELTLTAGEWVAAVEIDDAVVLFPGVRL